MMLKVCEITGIALNRETLDRIEAYMAQEVEMELVKEGKFFTTFKTFITKEHGSQVEFRMEFYDEYSQDTGEDSITD
jgi:uncharacterized lipoprotein NlpE involved in copper resistance